MRDHKINRPVRTLLFAGAMLSAAACATVPATTTQTPEVTIPQEVVAMADPQQNLSTARLRAVDNCYWYEHSNPLETTLLPLRTVDGRPICAS
jgi:hypothetical protein